MTSQPVDGLLTRTSESAVADLAARLGVHPEAIGVLQQERITWPDGSLGCPQPGMAYTQALVDGSRVILRHEDRVFLYHAGGDAHPFLCESDDLDGGYDFVPRPGIDV